MALERLQAAGLPHSAIYSHAVKVGNTVYIAGQVSRNEQGAIVAPGDFRGQAHVKVKGRDESLVVSRIYSHLFKQM